MKTKKIRFMMFAVLASVAILAICSCKPPAPKPEYKITVQVPYEQYLSGTAKFIVEVQEGNAYTYDSSRVVQKSLANYSPSTGMSFTTKALDKDKEYRIWLTGRNDSDTKTTTDSCVTSPLTPSNQIQTITGFYPLDFDATGSSSALQIPDWLKNKTWTQLPADAFTTTSDSISFSLASSSGNVCGTNKYFNTLGGGVLLKANEGIDAVGSRKVMEIKSTDSAYVLFCLSEVGATRSITLIEFKKIDGSSCRFDISTSLMEDEDPATKHVDLYENTYGFSCSST